MSNATSVAPVASPAVNHPVVGPVMPIVSLNPYLGRWNIKARVTSKSAVRTWTNARGEGKLFSVDLADQSGGIRATAFNDSVDRFYEMLEVRLECRSRAGSRSSFSHCLLFCS